MKRAVVVPWADPEQKERFLLAWKVRDRRPDWLLMQHDAEREGCGATKNKGVRRAIELGVEIVVVLDDDCYPERKEDADLERFVNLHELALRPQQVGMFDAVTDPPSRGTPYAETSIVMPVAASMGFWNGIGDHCAVRQLATGGAPMTFRQEAVYGRYFPLCGMNLAFRPEEWQPWCEFIDVPRFDDIWMGWLWQREAYRRGHCFNLGGPIVKHSRQSNIWMNLKQEAEYLEINETLWSKIATCECANYDSLRSLLPV